MFNSTLQKLFEKFGYQLRRLPKSVGQFGPARITITEGLQHLRDVGFSPRTIIDVGAGYGTAPLLETFPEAHYLWLEPLKEFEDKLQELKKKYQGDIILAAAGSQSGKTHIAVRDDLLGSSIKDDGQYGERQTREIDVIPLNDLKERISLTEDVLLKVDVQGGELDVLDGAGDILDHIDVIQLEVSFFRFFEGIPIFDEVVAYMKDRNFVVYDILAGNTRPYDHALGQKDLFFVKADGRFRKTQRWE